MKRSYKKKGQAAVEFALILPVLILFIMGIIEFGLILNSYLALNNASREGARMAAVGGTDSQIKSVIFATSPNLKPSYMTIDIKPDELGRKTGAPVTVVISYNYHTIIPLIGDIASDVIKLKAEMSMRVE